jgi:hypothetical protein
MTNIENILGTAFMGLRGTLYILLILSLVAIPIFLAGWWGVLFDIGFVVMCTLVGKYVEEK